MMLYRIDNVGELPLTDILKQPITTSLDIHASTGTGEILSLRGEEPGTQYHITTVDPSTSFYILKCQTALTRIVLLVNSAPMSLAIEINSPLDDTTENAGRLPDLFPLATHQSSFLKRLDLPLKEIRSRLLFLDASFSETMHGSLSPISLTVLDYHGNSLINTVLCPRVQIKEYGRQVHGFSERDLLGKADGHEVLARLHSLVVDRVLVGFELRQKLAGLRVDLRAVCGLRELQGCAALARVMGCAGPWSLAAVAKSVLDHQFQEAVYSAEYIAHVVWRLYVALEAHWQDSGPPPATVAKAASSISVLAGYDRGGRRHIKEAAGINY